MLQLKFLLITFVKLFANQESMDRTTIQSAIFPGCPIRNILSRICDKWSLLALCALEKVDGQTLRFKQLQREIPDISQKMLTTTLRTLEEDGMVKRRIYAEVPPRVEYSLTERANTLFPHIYSLIGWALENFDSVISHRKELSDNEA